jgi:hypothetical protein
MKNKKLNMNKKMKSNFTFKNKYIKEKINLDKFEDNTNFNEFLMREKMFEYKLYSNKEKMMKSINDEIFSKMQTKPNIDEKSRKIMNDKSKRQKRIKQNNSTSRINNKRQLMRLENCNSDKNFKTNNNNIKTIVNNGNRNNIKRKYTFEKLKAKKNLTINNIDKEANDIKRTNSENNIKIKRNQKMELYTSKINKFIKKSKSSKLIYMDRIKTKSDYDTIIKYNAFSASVKMKKIEILKINEQINNLCDKEINFYSFCQLLFDFGFVNIKHQEKYIMKYDEIDNNDEIIDNLLIRAYFDENLIAKEFIFNEINIIKNAFKSINENFIVQKYETDNLENNKNIEAILSDINFSISIHQFKLFVYIITNLFDGIDAENIIKINDREKSIKDIQKNLEDKNNVNVKKSEEIKNEKLYIFELIRKIVLVKNLDKFTTDYINNYKIHFNYMINNYEKFKILSEVQNKEKTNKQKEVFRNHTEYSFKPRVNKSKSINYFKDKLDNTKKNKENNFYKNQSLKNYELSKEKKLTFKPKIESPNLKKIFEKSLKNNTSVRNKAKKFDNILHNLKVKVNTIKEINKENTKVNNITNNPKKDNNEFLVTFNPEKLIKEKSENIKIESKPKTKINNKNQNEKINSNRTKKNNIKSVIMLNIKNAKKNSLLVIDPNDDYKEVINKFCIENEFQSEQYMKILQAVRYKINQNNF